MCFVGDYVVKVLSSSDHEALLEITRSYLEHVSDGRSLLSLIFLHCQDAPNTDYVERSTDTSNTAAICISF